MVPDQLVYTYIVLFLQSDTQTVMFYIDGPKVEELILLQIWNYLNLIWFKLQLEMLQLLLTKVKEVELFKIARTINYSTLHFHV